MQSKNLRSGNGCLTLIGMSILLAACGDESDRGKKSEAPDVFNVGDYVMNQCAVYYDDLSGWSECRDANQWSLRSNQPVFTALNDCLIAKGHEQDQDSLIWDGSPEDRDRGYADLVVCSVVKDNL